MSNKWLSVIDVTPPRPDCEEGGANTGEGTKGGSDGEEKQIEAERKTLDRLHRKRSRKGETVQRSTQSQVDKGHGETMRFYGNQPH